MGVGRGLGHLLALGVSLTVTLSAVAAGWLAGSLIQVVTVLGSAAMTLVLARLRRVPAALLLAGWAGVGVLSSWLLAGPGIMVEHPRDPRSLLLVATWVARIRSGEAGLDPALFRLDFLLALWLGGGWLTWCLERWRAPLLGMLPAVIGLSVTLVNLPAGQSPYVAVFLILFCAVLLWTHSEMLPSNWRARFVTTGAGIAVLAVITGSVLPPLTTIDTSGTVQNSLFNSWAQLMVGIGAGSQLSASATRSVGFSTAVSLSGPLQQGTGTVFTYTVPSGALPDAPLYFRGVNLSRAIAGEWRYLRSANRQALDRDSKPPYLETYGNAALYTVRVNMLHPPAADPSLFFYPGQLDSIDRRALLVADGGLFGAPGPLHSVASVDAAEGTSAGIQTLRVEIPDATEADLGSAGTEYPDWLRPFRSLGPPGSYLSAAADSRITALARQVTTGASNPYEQAKAIELFLRSEYRYTLAPPAVGAGQDPILAFLFYGKAGYCQYFATAMADLLRSLGIPTRLVNGYGAGTFDPRANAWVVRESDAHTWVESYFPGSGWIPFEPTPDGHYFSIPRAQPATVATDPAGVSAVLQPVATAPAAPPPAVGAKTGAAPGAGGRARTVSILLIEAILIVAVLIVGVLGYLRPRRPAQIWGRALRLSGWLGVRKRPAETPLEFGRRASAEWSRGGAAILRLAEAVTTIAYSAPGMHAMARVEAAESWVEVRGHALAELWARLVRRGSR